MGFAGPKVSGKFSWTLAFLSPRYPYITCENTCMQQFIFKRRLWSNQSSDCSETCNYITCLNDNLRDVRALYKWHEKYLPIHAKLMRITVTKYCAFVLGLKLSLLYFAIHFLELDLRWFKVHFPIVWIPAKTCLCDDVFGIIAKCLIVRTWILRTISKRKLCLWLQILMQSF